jgi:hypothetical protein
MCASMFPVSVLTETFCEFVSVVRAETFTENLHFILESRNTSDFNVNVRDGKHLAQLVVSRLRWGFHD